MDKEQLAIMRIQTASEMSLQHYGKPIEVQYSGGKDSDVLVELFKRSGVPFSVEHSLTTVDAPETVRHIKDQFKKWELEGIKCEVDKHEYIENGKKKRVTMWNLIPKKKRPPTRIVRYCCAVLKETRGKNSFVATGVRKTESARRKIRTSFESPIKNKAESIKYSDRIMLNNDNDEKRLVTERCMQKNEMLVNPIIDWTDRELWDFISQENLEVCSLYNDGFYRVGCVGCPMAGKNRKAEFARYPKFENAYKRAFSKMIEAIKAANGADYRPRKWGSVQEVFEWWMEEDILPGQIEMVFDEYGEIELKEHGT